MAKVPDPITIPEAELASVKEQVLQGLRTKYLRCKAEWLAADSNAKTHEINMWKKNMDEAVTAYLRVEADL